MSTIDMLGWAGSVLVVASLTQRNLHKLRLINLAASGAHLAFNLLLGIFPMIALNLVLVGINCYYLLGGSVALARFRGLGAMTAPTQPLGLHRAALPLSQAYRHF